MASKAAVSFNLKQPSQAEIDAALERVIDDDYRAFLKAVSRGDDDMILAVFDVMRAHIQLRSEMQIKAMERRLPAPWRS